MTAPISGAGHGGGATRPASSLPSRNGPQVALPLPSPAAPPRDVAAFSTAGVLLAQLEARNTALHEAAAAPAAPRAAMATAAYAGQAGPPAASPLQDSAQFSAASVLLAQLDADSGGIQDIALLLAQPPSSAQDAVARLSVLLSRRLGVLLQQEGLATARPLGFEPGPQGRVLLDPATHPEPARVQALLDSHADLQALARYLTQAGPIQLQTMALGREAARTVDLTPPANDAARHGWLVPIPWVPRLRPLQGARRWPAWVIALLASASMLMALALM